VFLTEETRCVQVWENDRLVGCAVLFSGGWDAWISDGLSPSVLVRIACNLENADIATTAIIEQQARRGRLRRVPGVADRDSCPECNADKRAAKENS
jgi:hypothetical protein